MTEGLLLPHERAIELCNFASALTMADEFDAALAAQQEVLTIFRQLGDLRSEAMTLGNMALVRQRQGKWNKAVRLHTLALEVFLEGRDDHGMAAEVYALSSALFEMGRHVEALKNLELAADLYHKVGDRHRVTDMLNLIDEIRGRFGVGTRALESRSAPA